MSETNWQAGFKAGWQSARHPVSAETTIGESAGGSPLWDAVYDAVFVEAAPKRHDEAWTKGQEDAAAETANRVANDVIRRLQP